MDCQICWRSCTIIIALLLTALVISTSASAQQRAACLAPVAQQCEPGRLLGWEIPEQQQLVTTLEAAVASAWFQRTFPDWQYCHTTGGQTAWIRRPNDACDNAAPYDFSLYARYQQCPQTLGLAASAPASAAATDPGAGNHFYTDIHLRSGLNHILYYNSGNAAAGAIGGFGAGWTHHYERSILRAPRNSDAVALRHDGSTITLRPTSYYEWKANGGTETLSEWWDGYIWHGWIYRNASGVEEWYDTAGKLLYLWDGNNVQQTVYDSGTTLYVWDRWGRALLFDKDGSGRIYQVTTPQGNIISYLHDGANLEGVYFPTGLMRWYGYGGKWGHGVGGPSAMTSVWNDNDLASVTNYDADGRSIPPSDSGNSYIVPAPEQFAMFFGLRFALPRSVSPSGTSGASQPPRGHSMPVPPGMEQSFPLERADRLGNPLLFAPDASSEESERWKRLCVSFMIACLRNLNPELKPENENELAEAAMAQGQCPRPPELNAGGEACFKTATACVAAAGMRMRPSIIWPDGRVMPGDL